MARATALVLGTAVMLALASAGRTISIEARPRRGDRADPGTTDTREVA